MSSRDNFVVDWCCVSFADDVIVAVDVDGFDATPSASKTTTRCIFERAPNFQNVVIVVVVAVGAIAAVQDWFHFQFDLQ